MEKKALGIGAAAAAAVTAAVAVSVPGTTDIEGSYSIKEISPYKSEIRITVPEEFTPDIVTLKMNDIEVAKTLLPQGSISTYPTVVSDTDRLTLDMYVKGDEAAEAVFGEDGKLEIKVKNNYIKEDAEDAE